MDTVTAPTTAWPLWRRIIFRFFFVLLCFLTAPWTWLASIPGLLPVIRYYVIAMDWLVHLANAKLFHVRDVLVPKNGSGDTSQGWAQLWLQLSLALVGCVIWSVLDRRRINYTRLNYWLCLFTRYFITFVAFIYGFAKVFALQMPFPNLHQLATPLGDLLPMRFSWFFIGYSTPYQVFSGVMEVTAGLLLLWRRTASLGVFVATAVFINVMMLNLCYDIPVKIFSMEMVLLCLFLLTNESKRFIYFFILNKPTDPCRIYHFEYPERWMRITRLIFKVLFIVLAIGLQVKNDYAHYNFVHKAPKKSQIKNGVYEVTSYIVNNVQLATSDSLRWKDAIFENSTGSTVSSDTRYRHSYGRAYFGFKVDSIAHTMTITNASDTAAVLYTMHYTLPDTNTIQLRDTDGLANVVIDLKRTRRHFQLSERQFHWVIDHNP